MKAMLASFADLQEGADGPKGESRLPIGVRGAGFQVFEGDRDA